MINIYWIRHGLSCSNIASVYSLKEKNLKMNNYDLSYKNYKNNYYEKTYSKKYI